MSWRITGNVFVVTSVALLLFAAAIINIINKTRSKSHFKEVHFLIAESRRRKERLWLLTQRTWGSKQISSPFHHPIQPYTNLSQPCTTLYPLPLDLWVVRSEAFGLRTVRRVSAGILCFGLLTETTVDLLQYRSSLPVFPHSSSFLHCP